VEPEAATLGIPATALAAAEASPDDERLTREAPGRYHLDREFGRGGQAVVLLAYDEHIGRDVAFKQLLPEHRAEDVSSSSAGRFLREARVTAQLEHPGIVPVHEVGRRADGSLYYTQKLVRGRTLHEAIHGCASLEERLALLPNFLSVCQAVAYAHGRGVIHRDLKPQNVMVGEFGETVVLDWGLARLRKEAAPNAASPARPVQSLLESNVERTRAGSLLGTPAYMSPEQAVGDVAGIDERSDVWSLGVMLFELLAGGRPFDGETVSDVLRKVATTDAPAVQAICPSAPAELCAIAARALAKDPARRYRDATELSREVSVWFAGGRVAAYEYSSWDLLRRFASRNRFQLIIAILIAAPVLYTGGSWLLRLQSAAEAQRQWMVADAALHEIDSRMSVESDPGVLRDMESRRTRLEAEARRTQLLADELRHRSGPGITAKGDELDEQIRAILHKFGTDTYAVPPHFKQRLRSHIQGMVSDPMTRTAWARRNQYWPLIHREFAALGLPEELAYVAWQEARFDPLALSPVGARGIWQFMDSQARRYGLQVAENWREGGVDERTDVAKETKIAARYIFDLLTEFGSDEFMLAIASYNQGENRVRRILHDAGFRKDERSFWHLYRLKKLPNETTEYVARIIAGAIIGNDPARYGLMP